MPDTQRVSVQQEAPAQGMYVRCPGVFDLTTKGMKRHAECCEHYMVQNGRWAKTPPIQLPDGEMPYNDLCPFCKGLEKEEQKQSNAVSLEQCVHAGEPQVPIQQSFQEPVVQETTNAVNPPSSTIIRQRKEQPCEGWYGTLCSWLRKKK